MKQTLVAKLKLHTTPEQFAALRQTQLAYRDALNYVSRYAFQHGKRASKKQRKANRHTSHWAFAELHSYLTYKAAWAGSMAVKVDASYTSQACPRCGYTAKANRPSNGLLFVCQTCHYALHADLVGARNVSLRTLLVRQDWTSTGRLSIVPDVSSDEAKAARRSRYAELRWSLDTSPAL